MMSEGHTWDGKFYDSTVHFVTTYGEELVDVLAPQVGELILDLGCGTGHLTAQIRDMGARVIGVDASESMIGEARQAYPEIDFRVCNGEEFQLIEEADAVFSNAALHWMKNARGVIQSVKASLRRGGRFVAEMGGENNVYHLTEALYGALEEQGIDRHELDYPWFFPSVRQYTTLLEQEGFSVTHVHYFDRPTLLGDSVESVKDWFSNFSGQLMATVSEPIRELVMDRAVELAAPQLFKDGNWYADYKRLRFVAVKK